MLKIGVLISGSGTTLQCMIDSIQSGDLKAEIAVVVSNKADAFGLTRATNAKIPTFVVNTLKRSVESYSADIFLALKSHNVNLVVMAGFLKKYLPPTHEIPTINIHPSLLPAFGGKGMYGHHVHQAVKDYGCKVSGCTVHYVSDEYDTGPVIAQEVISISHHDTVDTIEKHVQALEKKVLIKVLQKFSENKITKQDRNVKVLP